MLSNTFDIWVNSMTCAREAHRARRAAELAVELAKEAVESAASRGFWWHEQALAV